MSIRVLALALILGLGLASPATAEEGEDFGRTGGYAGLGLALGWEAFRNAPGALDWETGIGFDAWGGYRFARHFAAEMEIAYIDRLNEGSTDANMLTFTTNLKAYLCDCRFQPFVLAGVGVSRTSQSPATFGISSEADFAARFGGGLDIYLNEDVSWTTTASYVLNTGDLSNFDYVSMVTGFQFRF